MGRFEYLETGLGKGDKKAAKKAKKLEKVASKKSDRRRSQHEEDHGPVEVVYVRRETIRAAWRELKADGAGESLSELVDDLLLAWLNERQQERHTAADDDDDEEAGEDADAWDGGDDD